MSQVKALENMIRRVIREEIAEAVPAIVESIVENVNASPTVVPSRPASEEMASVRELLRNNVDWQPPTVGSGGTGFPTQQPVAAQKPALITVERGVDGGPPPPINEATAPVYEVINRDFSDVMKKLNLK